MKSVMRQYGLAIIAALAFTGIMIVLFTDFKSTDLPEAAASRDVVEYVGSKEMAIIEGRDQIDNEVFDDYGSRKKPEIYAPEIRLPEKTDLVLEDYFYAKDADGNTLDVIIKDVSNESVSYGEIYNSGIYNFPETGRYSVYARAEDSYGIATEVTVNINVDYVSEYTPVFINYYVGLPKDLGGTHTYATLSNTATERQYKLADTASLAALDGEETPVPLKTFVHYITPEQQTVTTNRERIVIDYYYEPETYTVTMKDNLGTINESFNIEYGTGLTFKQMPDLQSSGYDSDNKWTCNGVSYKPNDKLTVDKDMNFTTTYTLKTVTYKVIAQYQASANSAYTTYTTKTLTGKHGDKITLKATDYYTPKSYQNTPANQTITLDYKNPPTITFSFSHKCNSGHAWGSWVTTKNPTCTATGSKKQTCAICSKVNTTSIPKKAHTYTSSSAKIEPSGTEHWERAYKANWCTGCSQSYLTYVGWVWTGLDSNFNYRVDYWPDGNVCYEDYGPARGWTTFYIFTEPGGAWTGQSVTCYHQSYWGAQGNNLCPGCGQYVSNH